MSVTCDCPFSDMEIPDLKGLEPVNLVQQCIGWINALSQKKSNSSMIIQIATHLQSESECAKIIELDEKSDRFKSSFEKAFSSIRVAIDYLIVSGLYRKDRETIKNLYTTLDMQTKEGLDFWKGKLLSGLLADLNMKSAKVWIRNHCEIMCIIKTFGFKEEDFKVLLNDALDDGYLNELSDWINDRAKVESLVTSFDIPKERIDLILDSALDSDYLKVLSNWNGSEVIRDLIELFNLSEERVFQYLKDLIHERFLRCSKFAYMTTDDILHQLPSDSSFLSECISIEKQYFKLFDETKYQGYADEIMKIANNGSSEKTREMLARLATHVYSHVDTRLGINIPSAYTSKGVNKAIFLASKVAEFEYIIQGTDDGWMNRNLAWR